MSHILISGNRGEGASPTPDQAPLGAHRALSAQPPSASSSEAGSVAPMPRQHIDGFAASKGHAPLAQLLEPPPEPFACAREASPVTPAREVASEDSPLQAGAGIAQPTAASAAVEPHEMVHAAALSLQAAGSLPMPPAGSGGSEGGAEGVIASAASLQAAVADAVAKVAPPPVAPRARSPAPGPTLAELRAQQLAAHAAVVEQGATALAQACRQARESDVLRRALQVADLIGE